MLVEATSEFATKNDLSLARKRHGFMSRPVSDRVLAEFSAREWRELAALEALPETAIDTGDMPEVEIWSGAQRGWFYRPVKRQITLRLDADVVDFFERGGKGYQTRMNQA